MNGAPALKFPPDFVLTILNGADKGVAYKLLGEKISLGRAPENDVVINDVKASRMHAKIERRNGGVWLVDLGSKIGLMLNGKVIRESLLKEGDVIHIGDTTLRFGTPPKNMSLASPPPIPSRPFLKTQKTSPFIVVIAIGLVVAVVILSQSNTFKLKKIKMRDESSYDQQIEGTSEFNEKQEQVILEKGKDTQQYAEAQAFYLRGFREFRESNYGRAVQDFEAALALYPNHILAKRYLERSRLKNNEYITNAMERGERDFQLQRYMSAFNEYRTVILLTSDPKNKNYQLAQKRIETIQLILTNNR